MQVALPFAWFARIFPSLRMRATLNTLRIGEILAGSTNTHPPGFIITFSVIVICYTFRTVIGII